MKIIPAAQALNDFGAAAERPAAVAGGLAAKGDAKAQGDDARDMEARLQRAHAQGMAAGRAQAEAALAGERARMERAHREEMARQAERWRRETGGRLAEQLAGGLAELERVVSENVAEILAPLVEEAARRRAVEKLRDELRRMLEARAALKVHVKGPEAMLEALRQGLDKLGENVILEACDDCGELTAQVDETLIETRAGAWARAIFESREDGKGRA